MITATLLGKETTVIPLCREEYITKASKVVHHLF